LVNALVVPGKGDLDDVIEQTGLLEDRAQQFLPT
jgi:hypothetical protein